MDAILPVVSAGELSETTGLDLSQTTETVETTELTDEVVSTEAGPTDTTPANEGPDSDQLDDVMARLQKLQQDETTPATDESMVADAQVTEVPAEETAAPENDLEAALARLKMGSEIEAPTESPVEEQTVDAVVASPEATEPTPEESVPAAPAEDLQSALARLQQGDSLTTPSTETVSDSDTTPLESVTAALESDSDTTPLETVTTSLESVVEPAESMNASASDPAGFDMENMLAQLENSSVGSPSVESGLVEAVTEQLTTPAAETLPTEIPAASPVETVKEMTPAMETPSSLRTEREIDPTIQSEWDSIEGTSPTSLFGLPESSATEATESSSSDFAESTETAESLEMSTPEPTFTPEPAEEAKAGTEERLESKLSALRDAFKKPSNDDVAADAGVLTETQESPAAAAELLEEIGTPVNDEQPGQLSSSMLDAIQSEPETPEVEVPSEETSTEEAAPQNESVADLLARMKAEGSTSFEEPAEDEMGEVETEMQPEPVVESLEDSESNGDEQEGDVDVDDYMNQLFTRLRGPDGAAAVAASKPKSKKVSAAKKAKKVETPEAPAAPVAPVDPLTAETFKPSKVAPKRDLSAMRELANSSARKAVKTSNGKRNKAMKIMQLSLLGGGMALSALLFMSTNFDFTQLNSYFGIASALFAGFAGFRFLKSSSDAPVAKVSQELAQAEAVEEEVVA